MHMQTTATTQQTSVRVTTEQPLMKRYENVNVQLSFACQRAYAPTATALTTTAPTATAQTTID